MKRKVIITCAVTGGQQFNPAHPSFPITPEEIANSALEAAAAGATIVHCHVRDTETKLGVRSTAKFREVVTNIRDSGVDLLINLTGGDGGFLLPDPMDETKPLPGTDVVPWQERVEHIVSLRPDIASLDVTTANQADGAGEYVYLNTPYTLRNMARAMIEAGVRPELECFQGGDILFARELIEHGYVTGKPMFQFVLGIKWAEPPTPESIIHMRSLLPSGCEWTAMSIAQNQFPAAAQSVLAGGHVRVGLEDNLYLERGVFATNGELVERAVRIIRDLGCEVATADEARQILEL